MRKWWCTRSVGGAYSRERRGEKRRERGEEESLGMWSKNGREGESARVYEGTLGK